MATNPWTFRLAMAVTCVALVGTSCDKPVQKNSPATTPYDQMRQQVVERLQKGLLRPDASGVVALPDELKDAATDSRVITSRDPVIGLVVGFNLSLTASSRPEYLVYTENGLPEQSKSVAIGTQQFTLGRKTRNHWYQAIRSPR